MRVINDHARTMIAIVDDNAAVCDSTQILLEAYGFDVRTYLSGGDFLRENPDVNCVIVDYRMPNLNGFELIAELRQRGNAVPAIMITATDDPTVESRVAELRIRQVLKKPLDPQVLLGAIRRVLE
jgi:two-component system, LuxR family, response regulator FixJ